MSFLEKEYYIYITQVSIRFEKSIYVDIDKTGLYYTNYSIYNLRIRRELFTGLINNVGTIKASLPAGGGKRLDIAAEFDTALILGESIAVDGVCLTVAAIGNSGFAADVSPETLERTTLGKYRCGDSVNIERSLQASDRLGGHIVQGHIDCVGKALWIRKNGDYANLAVSYPAQYAKYIVEKGSIAVHGVSLTIAKLRSGQFEVALVPETLERTTLGDLKPGVHVNLEFDILAKYVEKIIKHRYVSK